MTHRTASFANTITRRMSAAASVLFVMSTASGVVSPDNPDSLRLELHEVEVTATSRPLVSGRDAGARHLSASGVASLPSLTGTPDALHAIQSLPGVSSNSELTGGIYVYGGDNSVNRISVAGHRIVNPMHLLGIFPTFNNSYFSSFGFEPVPVGFDTDMSAGAVIDAVPHRTAPYHTTGSLNVGLIESSGNLAIPLQSDSSMITVGLRGSYIDLLFGNALRIDNSTLGYRFGEFNAGYTRSVGRTYRLTVDMMATSDRAVLSNRDYLSTGRLTWYNLMLGATLTNGKTSHDLTVTSYGNGFEINESGLGQLFPSSYLSASYGLTVSRESGLSGGASASVQRATLQTGQHTPPGIGLDTWCSYQFRPASGLTVTPAVGFCSYAVPGHRQYHLAPLPRLAVGWQPTLPLTIGLRYASAMQSSILVRESTAGLPANFLLNVCGDLKPVKAHTITVYATLSTAVMNLTAEAYYRRTLHMPEFDGAILNLLNAGYDPLDDIRDSNGHTRGISLMASRGMGRLRGWVTYNLAFSQFRWTGTESGWFPSSHDRKHDLKINLLWNAGRHVTVGGTWILATGYPYTKASYGYMIGENLICEYMPHNSSRMPTYARLDLSARFVLSDSRRVRQSLSLSVYNVLAHHNILFVSTSYSTKKGIHTVTSTMESVIPSLNYTIELK